MKTTQRGYHKCKGSRTKQMIDWLPNSESTKEFPTGYPGSSVCIYCSYGVLIVKGSSKPATSQTGHKGQAGILRTHYVNDYTAQITYDKPASLRNKKS